LGARGARLRYRSDALRGEGRLCLTSRWEWQYTHTLEGRRCCRVEIIWEITDHSSCQPHTLFGSVRANIGLSASDYNID
jgi:hypothetical protein